MVKTKRSQPGAPRRSTPGDDRRRRVGRRELGRRLRDARVRRRSLRASSRDVPLPLGSDPHDVADSSGAPNASGCRHCAMQLDRVGEPRPGRLTYALPSITHTSPRWTAGSSRPAGHLAEERQVLASSRATSKPQHASDQAPRASPRARRPSRSPRPACRRRRSSRRRPPQRRRPGPSGRCGTADRSIRAAPHAGARARSSGAARRSRAPAARRRRAPPPRARRSRAPTFSTSWTRRRGGAARGSRPAAGRAASPRT